MHLRLYRTTLAAAPLLFDEFGAPFLGKMVNTGVRSVADADSTNPHVNESEAVCDISSLQCEASTSISDHNDTALPTSFGKKPLLRKQKVHHTHHQHREAKRRSKPSSPTLIDKPFDICAGESYVSRSYRAEGHDMEDLFQERELILRPGMVLFKQYITLLEQVNIVKQCRELGCGPGGFYQPGYHGGAKLHLQMMCLGLDWNPRTRRYEERRQHDDAVPPHLPSDFTSLVSRVLRDSHALIERNSAVGNVEDILPTMEPDVCIVNFYTTNGRLGLHQDRDETQESLDRRLPVVSISIGDSAIFKYGDWRDAEKAESVLLESGDVLVFGGESRHIYHGVETIVPGSAPPLLLERTNLRPGRLNLTFRKH